MKTTEKQTKVRKCNNNVTFRTFASIVFGVKRKEPKVAATIVVTICYGVLPLLAHSISSPNHRKPIIIDSSSSKKTIVKRNLLIEELLAASISPRFDKNDSKNNTKNSDHNFEPISTEKVTNDEKSNHNNNNNNRNHQAQIFRHKFLPFRIKYLNDTDDEDEDEDDENDDDEENDDEDPQNNNNKFSTNFYTHDRLLEFDSPFYEHQIADCDIRYQLHANQPVRSRFDIFAAAKSDFAAIQAEISGSRCGSLLNLALLQLRFASNITHVIIRDTQMRTLERRSFARLPEIVRVDLIGNGALRAIERRAFDGAPKLRIVRIFDCENHSENNNNNNFNNNNNNNPTITVHRHALKGAERLRQLVWACGRPNIDLLRNLTRAASWRAVPQLRHLHIGSSTIPQSAPSNDIRLAKNDLIGLRQIKKFTLSSGAIRYIHPLAFTFMRRLVTLNLVVVEADDDRNDRNRRLRWSSAKNIIEIFAAIAKISSNESQLSNVDVSGNLPASAITRFLTALSRMPTIRAVYLRRIANLRTITNATIPEMLSLTRLYLDDNRELIAIADNAFDRLPNLELLSLRSNRLSAIGSELFYNLPRLKYLYLSGDARKPISPLRVAPKTFVGLHLRVLDLSYRRLDPLPAKIFLGLHKTEKLYLRGCDLRAIEYLTFFFLKSLRLLDLSENERLIESLRDTHDDSFFGLESIESIRMSRCALNDTDLDPAATGIFARMHEQVRDLDLSENRLTQISAQHFAQFPLLKSLNLSSNRLITWPAAEEGAFERNAHLTQLDISGNRFERISSKMMEDLFRLQRVSFGDNPLRCDCALELFHGTWLASTISKPIRYLDTRNPLHSRQRYYCVDRKHHAQRHNLHQFRSYCAKQLANNRSANSQKNALINSYLVLLFVLAAFLISFLVLSVTFAFYAELNQIFANFNFGQFRRSIDENENANFEYQYDAFVSYNVADREWILTQLVPNLECRAPNPARLCVYDRDFVAGRPISECILESIARSRRVILVVSNHFVRSPWCRYETDLAHHHNTLLSRTNGRDGLIVIKLEPLDADLRVPIQLEFLLKTRIYLEWYDPTDVDRSKFWKKLHRSVCARPVAIGTIANQRTTSADGRSRFQPIKAKIYNFFIGHLRKWWWKAGGENDSKNINIEDSRKDGEKRETRVKTADDDNDVVASGEDAAREDGLKHQTFDSLESPKSDDDDRKIFDNSDDKSDNDCCNHHRRRNGRTIVADVHR